MAFEITIVIILTAALIMRGIDGCGIANDCRMIGGKTAVGPNDGGGVRGGGQTIA